jgi:phage tail protein X
MPQRIISYINYITKEGDTFDSLALSVYNDEKMASKIIDSNPDYADVVIFDANTAIRIPVFDGSSAPETLPPWRRDE